MLFPISQLLEGCEPPVCVPHNTHVREAIKLMMRNGYSQLPVVDDDGLYIGIISDKIIAHTYFLLDGSVSLLDLDVSHCLRRADPLSPDDDVFEACDRLDGEEHSVVIVDERKPVGILTSSHMANFFRHRSEDFIRVEDIEVTLRLRTRDAFPDDAAMDQALMVALGPSLQDPNKPRKEFNELSLGDLIIVMTADENWPRFSGRFEPIDLFKSIMNRVRQVRNLLAHFRGHANQIQDSTLRYAIDWLSMRSIQAKQPENSAKKVTIAAEDIPANVGGNRFDKLRLWLSKQPKETNGLRLNFRDVETLLGGLLPSSARKHTTWWSSPNSNDAQVLAWRSAGWQVSDVNLTLAEVTFAPLKDDHRLGGVSVSHEANATNNVKIDRDNLLTTT